MTLYEILKLVTVALSLAAIIFGWTKAVMAQIKGIRKGVQALLRADMIDMYNHYKDKGHAPIYARDNFENIWIQYHALGANGVMDDIHHKFMALPIDEEDK